MARGLGGEGGARGGRDPNAGGRGDVDRARSNGNGGFGGGIGNRGTLAQQQDRINQENARRAGNSAPGVRGQAFGGGSFGGQVPGAPTRDQVQTQDRIAANVAKAQRDYEGRDDSFIDRVGNLIASGFGFNEMDPTQPGYSAPGAPGMTGRADWGFDPVGALAGMAGTAFGVPGVGLVADQLSSLAGRPLEMNMGPDVLAPDANTTGTAPTEPGGISTASAGTFGGAGGAPTPGQSEGSGLSLAQKSYLTGRPARPTEQPVKQTPNPADPGTFIEDDTPTPAEAAFEGPAPVVAAARSPFNSRIGGSAAGGFALGRTKGGRSSRSSSPTSLAEGLQRYKSPYDVPLNAGR